MAQTQTTHPLILWAQRNDTILLTVQVNDICNEKYKVDEKTFTFDGDGGDGLEKYHCELEFHKEIVPQESKHKKTDRGLFFVLKKKESGPYWPRLVAGDKKVPYVKTDFNRWRDEDESESDSESFDQDANLQAMMQQMGGLGSRGVSDDLPPGMDDLGDSSSDSDDEPVPGLET